MPKMRKLRALSPALMQWQAAAAVDVDDEVFAKCETLMERLLELDDVDSVYTNCDGLEP